MVASLPEGYQLVDRYKLIEPGNISAGYELARGTNRPICQRFVENIETGDLYLWDERSQNGAHKRNITPNIVRGKCLAITIGIVMYVALKIFRDTLVTIACIGGDLFHGRFVEMLKEVGRYGVDRLRDPIFAVAILATALFGLVFPFRAREVIERTERLWHRIDTQTIPPHKLVRRDCRFSVEKDWKVIFSRDHVLFLAVCFQKRGNREENRYDVSVHGVLGIENENLEDI